MRRGAASNYTFLTQKERDIETGLDYFEARYYSSNQGRFTSPDEFKGGPEELYTFADDASGNPTFYADPTEPQSLNKYQYAYNNPLRYTDPNGHCPDCADIIKVGAIAAGSAEGTPGLQVVGVVIAAGTVVTVATVAVYENWDGIKAGLKGTYSEGGGQCMSNVGCPPVDAQAYRAREGMRQVRGQSQGQTDEKAKNLADADKKGIPKDQLGPSRKPKVHVVKHPTEKSAKDAARAEGQGAPAKDATPTRGGPHYHPTNGDGSRKKGKQNIHHEYPG